MHTHTHTHTRCAAVGAGTSAMHTHTHTHTHTRCAAVGAPAAHRHLKADKAAALPHMRPCARASTRCARHGHTGSPVPWPPSLRVPWHPSHQQGCARHCGQSGALPCAAYASTRACIHPSSQPGIRPSVSIHPSRHVPVPRCLLTFPPATTPTPSLPPSSLPAHRHRNVERRRGIDAHPHVSGRALCRLESFGCALSHVRALSDLPYYIIL